MDQPLSWPTRTMGSTYCTRNQCRQGTIPLLHHSILARGEAWLDPLAGILALVELCLRVGRARGARLVVGLLQYSCTLQGINPNGSNKASPFNNYRRESRALQSS